MININPSGRFMKFIFSSTVELFYAKLFPFSEMYFILMSKLIWPRGHYFMKSGMISQILWLDVIWKAIHSGTIWGRTGQKYMARIISLLGNFSNGWKIFCSQYTNAKESCMCNLSNEGAVLNSITALIYSSFKTKKESIIFGMIAAWFH
jgi:hypothetical protein